VSVDYLTRNPATDNLMTDAVHLLCKPTSRVAMINFFAKSRDKGPRPADATRTVEEPSCLSIRRGRGRGCTLTAGVPQQTFLVKHSPKLLFYLVGCATPLQNSLPRGAKREDEEGGSKS